MLICRSEKGSDTYGLISSFKCAGPGLIKNQLDIYV